MVLVLGFEGYGGRSKNPSEAIVEQLNGSQIRGATINAAVLPVSLQGMRARVQRLLDQHQPVIALAFGLWPGETVIRLERVGINCADFEIPDNVGHLADEPVAHDGQDAYLSTLPLAAIRQRLLQAGIPARLSGSAGTYLCNALLYSMLEYSHHKKLATRCGFVHVPYLPAQVAELLDTLAQDAQLELHQRADTASMNLDLMVAAARVIIETSLEEAA